MLFLLDTIKPAFNLNPDAARNRESALAAINTQSNSELQN